MEQITKTREIKETFYQAVDATEFISEEECIRYENTCEAILLSKLSKIEINRIPCEDLFESSGEGEYRIVVPTCLEDISNLNQLYLLRHNTCTDLPFSDLDINNIILVGVRFNCEKLDWIWFWKFNDTIKNITNNKYKLIANNENN